jgi:hypothetical protein
VYSLAKLPNAERDLAPQGEVVEVKSLRQHLDDFGVRDGAPIISIFTAVAAHDFE